MLIRENNGRGLQDPPPLSKVINAVASTSSFAATTPKPSAGFLKPAGVDAPTASIKRKNELKGPEGSINSKRAREHDIPGMTGGGKEKSKRKMVTEDL